MNFVIDAQLPPVLVWVFRGMGHACNHVADLGLSGAKDEAIWRFAESNDAVIVTKDEDFALRKVLRPGKPHILWLRVGNCSNAALKSWFEPLIPALVARLVEGEELIEVI